MLVVTIDAIGKIRRLEGEIPRSVQESLTIALPDGPGRPLVGPGSELLQADGQFVQESSGAILGPLCALGAIDSRAWRLRGCSIGLRPWLGLGAVGSRFGLARADPGEDGSEREFIVIANLIDFFEQPRGGLEGASRVNLGRGGDFAGGSRRVGRHMVRVGGERAPPARRAAARGV
jgi:hypothetical protein